MLLIEGRLRRELHQLAAQAAPKEAVGLILSSGKVISLMNTSDDTTKFEVARDELRDALEDETDFTETVFWHSHPAGGIGPSRTDMQQKTPFTYHLVVALVDDQLVSTWY